MFKNKKGISLIVLMITIIVIIILASVIVITFSTNNPIGMANEAKFKSDLSGFRDELMATHTDKSTSDPDYVAEDVNVDVGDYKKMKMYIPDITKEYADKLLIKKGKLLYIGDDTSENYNEQEEKYAKEIGIQSPFGTIGDADGDGYITSEDMEYIRLYLSDQITTPISKRQEKAMDTNGDGKLNIDDTTMIHKYLDGSIDHMP